MDEEFTEYFENLVQAEQIYRESITFPQYLTARKVRDIAKHFLTVGCTSSFLKTGEIAHNDEKIETIIGSGFGSILVEAISEKTPPQIHFRKHRVNLLVHLLYYPKVHTSSMEYTIYLSSLRRAASCIFPTVVFYPSDLSLFLELTGQYERQPEHQKLIRSWFTNKNPDLLKVSLPFWKKDLDYKKIWKQCNHEISFIDKLIEESEHFPSASWSPVDVFGAAVTLANLSNRQFAKSLNSSDLTQISDYLLTNHWQKIGSALEILLLRKKYEANYTFSPDIEFCGVLNNAYRILCNTVVYTNSRECVIPSVFKDESTKIKKVLLQSTDLATALLEDLLRNDQSKVFTKNDKSRCYRFLSKRDLIARNVPDLLNDHYHPARIIETAASLKVMFDCFIIISITGKRLPFEEIRNAIQDYRNVVNHHAKLVIIGVDSMNNSKIVGDLEGTLIVCGVDEGTSSLIREFVAL
ncbi:unnamed protein product [Caenorhabditis brenneri]